MRKLIYILIVIVAQFLFAKAIAQDTTTHFGYTYREIKDSLYKKINWARQNPKAFDAKVKEVGYVPSKPCYTCKFHPTNALIIDSILESIAQMRAEDMAKNNYFDHKDLKGNYADLYVTRAGLKMAEGNFQSNGDTINANGVESILKGDMDYNVGMIFRFPEGLTTSHGHKLHLFSKMHPSHNAGIKDKDTHFGLGIAKDKATRITYIVYLSINKKGYL